MFLTAGVGFLMCFTDRQKTLGGRQTWLCSSPELLQVRHHQHTQHNNTAASAPSCLTSTLRDALSFNGFIIEYSVDLLDVQHPN